MRNFIIGFIAAVLMLAAKNAMPARAPREIDAEIAESRAQAIMRDYPRAIPSAPRIYTRYGTVYGLEYAEGAVIVETDDGELWEFYNGPTTEDWMIDDGCLLTFIDAGVPGWMYDDEIVHARYWNEEVH